MCQVHTGTYVALLAPEKPTVHHLSPRSDYHIPSIYYKLYISICIRTSDPSRLDKTMKKKETEKIILQ